MADKTTATTKAKAKKPEGWVDLGKGIYKSSNVSFPKLSPGTYEIKFNEQLGLIFVKKSIKTDKLIEFPDMVQDDVVKSIEEFWSRKDVFEEYGQLHKRGLFIYGPPGCHTKGTEVIKYDGSLVKVEDVAVGDRLMGPDSTPRRVSRLIRGRGKLYKVIPVKGKPFTVNEDHVLSLIKSGEVDSVTNLTVKEYLAKSFHWKSRRKLYRADMENWSKASCRKVAKLLPAKAVLRTGFTLEEAGNGNYYGFSLDKDQLYLLDDFTVTHNSGKTCTINILSNKLVALGGIVVYCTNPYLATEGLNTLRRIETDRPIIYVMEDIDEMLRQHGDQSLLSLLDGENKIENIVYVATSNYPELLNERFLDRPSRFDELIEVGMPSPEARGIYLRSVMNEEQLAVQELHQWVSDTDNFSIAHLRELFVSVKCLGREYGESLSRLKGMSVQPKSKKRKSASSLGFNEPSKQSAMGIKFPSSPVPELFRK